MSTSQASPPVPDSYDHEAQTSRSAKFQRTDDAIGDRTALIIKCDKCDDNVTSLICKKLGVEYKLTSTSRRWKVEADVSFTRRDAKEEKDVSVAEWEFRLFGTDTLRYLTSGSPNESFPTKTYLKRNGWFKRYLTITHRFEVNGRGYIWRSALLSDQSSMHLYSEGNDKVIAKTVGPRLCKSRYGYIEILHDEGILDHLVVTWAIARQRNQERAAWFNLIHVLLIDVLMMTLLEVLVWSKNHDS